MKIRIVGGDFKETPKESSVINKLSSCISNSVHGEMGYGVTTITNGGVPDTLCDMKLSGYNLVLWMPNVENDIDKVYPKKDKGSVLICSKVIHGDRTLVDAISRIFKMNGNAVIAIFNDNGRFSFKLIDALGNVWYDGSDIQSLSDSILSIYNWTTASHRLPTKQSNFNFDAIESTGLQTLVDLTKIVADKFESMGGRFFGNTSTRCMKMFPSERLDEEYILVSKRNIDKHRITTDDFVKVRLTDDHKEKFILEYIGENKPSVDTPIQSKIYHWCSEINYMIHGHSYIEDFPFTNNYFPCGDMREAGEVYGVIQRSNFCGGVNLVNHGFLIYSRTIEELENIVSNLKFTEREIGFEKSNVVLISENSI